MAAILIVRLFVVTVIQHGTWTESAESISTKSIYTTAVRGNIYDRNGKLLAGNKQSFSVRLSASDQTDEELNETIEQLNKILEDNGDEFVDNFPIKIKNGKYYYTYDSEIKSWLKKKGFNTNLTAEQAFEAMRDKLGIDPSLNRYDAQTEMQTTYNQYPPISVSDMKYTAEQEKEEFLQIYFGDDEDMMDLSAKEAFKKICDEMGINKALTDESARELMQARYEIDALGYSKYMPATVAEDVSDETVMLIDEGNGDTLKGVETISDTMRYYPNGNLASHIIGYLGKITDEEQEQYEDRGYENNALIGKEGIEGSFESILAGTNGEKVVQINSSGETEQVISEKSAEKGKDVYLTIDADLQEEAEDGLASTIQTMRYAGVGEAAPNAKTGAVVAIEVDTGDVLAMASYPDYDPNLFANGISDSDWESLQSENPRDSLSQAPLYNLATMMTVQPGSTFKPVTATAGLQCGLDPYEYHTDGGAITLGGTTFACVVWNLHKGSNHGPINMFRALEVSCNYYFYDVATGKDWYTGGSMGYDKDISIDMITDYAEQYGLGKATGIEIDEQVVPVPSEERKIATLKANLKNELYAASEEYFTADLVKDSDKLEENIDTIVGWLDDDDEMSWEELTEDRLPDLGVKKKKIRKVGELFLYDYYPQAEWTTGDAFNIAIGQGENSYTPLQMANYAATIGSHGVHHEVSVVKAVEDEGNTVKEKATKVDVDDDEYFDYIIEGMKLVANGSESTVSKVFGNMDVEVAAKTGTAERSGKVNPESEVDYIKEYLNSIAPELTWKEVKKEMKRLMDKYPDLYTSEDIAVRRAVINLTDGDVDSEDLDKYKSEYDPFAWVIAIAPADDPEIAVCAMVPQGSTAANASPIVKSVLEAYFDDEDDDDDSSSSSSEKDKSKYNTFRMETESN